MLVLLALTLPALFALLGLVIDGSLLLSEQRALQSLADAAATRAAWRLSQGQTAAVARTAAQELVQQLNGCTDATVTVNIPPTSGPFAGSSNYAEVFVKRPVKSHFMRVLDRISQNQVTVHAVAGAENATAGGVLAALDPDPTPIVISGLPLATIALGPVQIGGMEVLGLGKLKVQGAVYSNSTWGGVDENWDPAGETLGLPYGLACTPILPLTKLAATDIRVRGGVDNPNNFGSVTSGQPNPLKANRLPVPDPYASLPVPTVAADPVNVDPTLRGSRNVIALPLIPLVTLQPGVYEWIQVTSGVVRFAPGVYIIRNVNPLTGMALSVVAGQVTAEGVMFYITDNASYSANSGTPDSLDGETVPPPLGLGSVLPSALINMAVLGNSYSGLNAPGSPFDGMLIYQRRTSRRPLVIVAEQLLGSASVSGGIYAKWGQIAFAGHGTYEASIAAGTIRIVNALDCTFAPTRLFPPAKDVYLVQ